jgi:hypothetical protein
MARVWRAKITERTMALPELADLTEHFTFLDELKDVGVVPIDQAPMFVTTRFSLTDDVGLEVAAAWEATLDSGGTAAARAAEALG